MFYFVLLFLFFLLFFFLMLRPPPRFTLFPYTTLFRSVLAYGLSCICTRYIWQINVHQNEIRFGGHCFFYSLCAGRSEEHTSELQSLRHLVCRLLLEKKKKYKIEPTRRTMQQQEVENGR